MIRIGALIIWIVVGFLEGKRDGFFYHNRMSSINPDKQNIHWIFFISRLIDFILIIAVQYQYFALLSNILFAMGLVLIFSFIHNSIYYETRKKLSNGNLYPKGWRDTSRTSEARLEFDFKARVFMAITGAIGIIASFQTNF